MSAIVPKIEKCFTRGTGRRRKYTNCDFMQQALDLQKEMNGHGIVDGHQEVNEVLGGDQRRGYRVRMSLMRAVGYRIVRGNDQVGATVMIFNYCPFCGERIWTL